MSRHILTGRRKGTRVTLGWDQPLMTYFIQVADEEAERELDELLAKAGELTPAEEKRADALERRRLPVWRGTGYEELSLTQLQRLARRFVDLPSAVAEELYRDRDERRMNVDRDWRAKATTE